MKHLRKRHAVEFVTFKRQYPNFLFPGKTQYDESANPIRESNAALIDSVGPLSWWRTARALKRADPQSLVFNWWHPFFGLSYGAIVRLLPRRLRARGITQYVDQFGCEEETRNIERFMQAADEEA